MAEREAAGPACHNDLSGSAEVAAQARTVHGGIHVNNQTVIGVALVFVTISLVVVTLARGRETAPRESPATSTIQAVPLQWMIPRGADPLAEAQRLATELVERTWPEDAHVRFDPPVVVSRVAMLNGRVISRTAGCRGIVRLWVIEREDDHYVFGFTAVG
ncbi:hypothetical protein Lesp02_75710 [Lentzea sp. NBRC 105346]|uniref:hypothetical protein n=1 Tax=Lentzea sp. NBRC 105346 TaxID=3032205 RepID=UPI0024A12CDD|nr:hypothetical protein [Lentzea sp. NBRC 105346]GLZ35384.1 hypothetical protein Lesp02_75710 [Lentzea sp. NBRC 105346]